MRYEKICRKPRCNSHVEVYDEDNWSDLCPFHLDQEDDERREYAEDAAREEREYAAEREEYE